MIQMLRTKMMRYAVRVSGKSTKIVLNIGQVRNRGALLKKCSNNVRLIARLSPCKPTRLARNHSIGFDQFGGMESAIIPA